MFSTANFDYLVDKMFDQPNAWNTSITKTTKGYHSEKTEGSYLLELPVIGLTKDDLVIKTTNGRLEVKGGKKDHKWTPEFTKTFTLPDNANFHNIEATVENGLLIITIPVSEESERIIKII
jgi:HSP20 family molecular chaperone IbpA